jgi:phosphoadenosine phosphosulfate reductase
MGHMGDVLKIDEIEYKVLKLMDGFRTIAEIAEVANVSIENIKKIYSLYRGEKKVSDLPEWNKVGWCENCNVHVSGETCGICGRQVKKIIFSPPCDPVIGFSEEQKFILDILQDRFNIILPEDACFLINNGVHNNKFFWEIEYAGSIILKIEFQGIDSNSWKYSLMERVEIINAKKEYILNQENIKKNIKANTKSLNKLENDSIAIIAESSAFFRTKPLLYFSAGKESMVMYSLIKKANIPVNILTVVTGVEFPDDIAFIQKMRKEIETDSLFNYYFYQDNGEEVINMLNRQKKLSAEDPWCRVDFKRKLKSKGTEEIYKGEDFVAYEGSRWYENDFRRRHPKVNFISDYFHQVWVHPLAEWNSYDIWLYILKQGLPINPVYFKGFQRTTCWLCPIVTPFHLQNSQKYYPELWSRISECKLDAFGDDTTHDLAF